MIKLDDNLLAELGLGTLPKDEKSAFLKHMYETLEMRVGTRLAERMTDAQMAEFEQFISANDEQGAFQWLEHNFPNYKDVVAEEFDKLKNEIKPLAPQILVSSQSQAAHAGQPADPSAFPQNPQGVALTPQPLNEPLPPQSPHAQPQQFASASAPQPAPVPEPAPFQTSQTAPHPPQPPQPPTDTFTPTPAAGLPPHLDPAATPSAPAPTSPTIHADPATPPVDHAAQGPVPAPSLPPQPLSFGAAPSQDSQQFGQPTPPPADPGTPPPAGNFQPPTAPPPPPQFQPPAPAPTPAPAAPPQFQAPPAPPSFPPAPQQ